MSSDQPTSAPTNPHRKILWLVVGHIVVGLTGAFIAYSVGTPRSPTLLVVAFFGIFIGIVFSQTSLLGIWGGLGSDSWWKRLVGVVVGVGYLGPLLGIGTSKLDGEILFLVVSATMFVAVPLLIVRFFSVAVRLDSLPVASVGRIQFSIRHLMILTFIVACLIAIGKWVQPWVDRDDVFFNVLFFAITLGAVGVIPVWFVLATNQPLLYGVGLAALGTCAGYCLARTVDVGWEGLWMTATATEATAVVASLLVVRSCGYRLMHLPPRRQAER